MIRRLVIIATAFVALGITAAHAQAPAPLAVTGAWVREPVPGRSMTAAYAVVENPGTAEAALVSVSCDAAATAELHEMVKAGDMMKMQQVKSIAVPAGGKLELKPGGYHVMLFDLKKPLKEGDTIALTFTTSKGTTLKTQAVVKKGQM